MRNYGRAGLSWQEVFRTRDRGEVERRCRQAGLEFEWYAGECLRTRCTRPAVVRHPITGEPCWFNQAQHWHLSCLDGETRTSLLATHPRDELPRTCTFGDGTPITDEAIATILSGFQNVEVAFGWEAGDVELIDNVMVAHARNPYVGERRLLVALGDMCSYASVAAARAR